MLICHIVVVAIVRFIQYHIKITGIDARFPYPADFNIKIIQRQAAKHAHQFFFIRANIQQCPDQHIARHSGFAFQIVFCHRHSPHFPVAF